MIRYADILLMYAEALNELDGSYQIETWDNSGTHSISRNEDELKKGVQPVRIRAGIPDFTPEEYGNKELFRKKIKRERQIELMAEASILCRFEASLGYWTYLPSRPDNTSFYKDLYHCSVLHLSTTKLLRCMLPMHRIGVLDWHIEAIHFLLEVYKVLWSITSFGQLLRQKT